MPPAGDGAGGPGGTPPVAALRRRSPSLVVISKRAGEAEPQPGGLLDEGDEHVHRLTTPPRVSRLVARGNRPQDLDDREEQGLRSALTLLTLRAARVTQSTWALDRPSRRCGRADPARRDTPAVAARSSSVSGVPGPQSRGLMLKAHLKLLAAKSDWRRSEMRMMALVAWPQFRPSRSQAVVEERVEPARRSSSVSPNGSHRPSVARCRSRAPAPPSTRRNEGGL